MLAIYKDVQRADHAQLEMIVLFLLMLPVILFRAIPDHEYFPLVVVLPKAIPSL